MYLCTYIIVLSLSESHIIIYMSHPDVMQQITTLAALILGPSGLSGLPGPRGPGGANYIRWGNGAVSLRMA